MDFEPFDEYEAEMMRQHSKMVRKMLGIKEEKNFATTLTDFLAKGAASVLSFFKGKTKPPQQVEKPKEKEPIKEPVSQVDSKLEMKKEKPLVLFLKEGKVYQQQQQPQVEEDYSSSSYDSESSDSFMEDDDQEANQPASKAEGSLVEENSSPRKRVKTDQKIVYNKYYYSDEMLNCPMELKQKLSRIEHEAHMIIRNEAQKLIKEYADQCKNDSNNLEYSRNSIFPQRAMTPQQIAESNHCFEEMKQIKRLRVAREDKWPLRKKIHLDEETLPVMDVDKLMDSLNFCLEKTKKQRQERIRIQNERLDNIKRQQNGALESRIFADKEEEQKKTVEEKKRQEEIQRRMEQLIKRRNEEEEIRRKKEAEKNPSTPIQTSKNQQSKHSEVKQSLNQPKISSPKLSQSPQSDEESQMSSFSFESPKKRKKSKRKQKPEKKKQEIPQMKVQSSSSEKKENPFIRSPTKVFNLGEIINSNKLPSPFSLNKSPNNNNFMNNSSDSNNNEHRNLASSVQEKKKPVSAFMAGSGDQANSGFNLFVPQNQASSSSIFGSVYSSNKSPSSHNSSPNAHSSINVSPINSPLAASCQIKPSTPANLSGGLFTAFQNPAGFIPQGSMNTIDQSHLNPLNASAISNNFGGSHNASANPFIVSNDNRPMPSLFTAQNPQPSSNSSRKRQTKKNSTRIS